MKERPILFKGEMVRAIQDGRKTQTRRVIKEHMYFVGAQGEENDLSCYETKYGDYKNPDEAITWDRFLKEHPNLFKYGKVGDRLWVRETWSPDSKNFYPFDKVSYRATSPELGAYSQSCEDDYNTSKILGKKHEPLEGCACNFKWRPSIHMPRWASRITLEITNIRVERLQDISNGDILDEGIGPQSPDGTDEIQKSLKDQWRYLWHSINGPESWNQNPWVWVIEFKRLEQSK